MELTNAIDPAQWLRNFQTTPTAPAAPGTALRLVCFPHAGGSASYFFRFAAAMRTAATVQAVQYPGRQDRRAEPLVGSVDVLAERIAEVLDDDDPTPTAFFGHSMGATVAFEVARRWADRGRELVCFFASGRRAPSLLPRLPVPMETDQDALAEMKRLNGTDNRLLDDDEILRLFLPVMRNDFRAAEAYRFTPGTELSCPVVAMRGVDDPHVFAEDAERWRTHTSGAFESHTFDGGHFYLDTRYAAAAKLVDAKLAELT